MITIGQVLHNPYDKSVLGAVRTFELCLRFRPTSEQLAYLGRGRTLLFEEYGYVIADSANTITKLITYRSDHAILPSQMPGGISSSSPIRLYCLKVPTTFCRWILATSGGQYMLVTSSSKQYVSTHSLPSWMLSVLRSRMLSESLLVLLLAYSSSLLSFYFGHHQLHVSKSSSEVVQCFIADGGTIGKASLLRE